MPAPILARAILVDCDPDTHPPGFKRWALPGGPSVGSWHGPPPRGCVTFPDDDTHPWSGFALDLETGHVVPRPARITHGPTCRRCGFPHGSGFRHARRPKAVA